MYALKLTCNFSVQQLGKQRMSFRHKICFKDSLGVEWKKFEIQNIENVSKNINEFYQLH